MIYIKPILIYVAEIYMYRMLFRKYCLWECSIVSFDKYEASGYEDYLFKYCSPTYSDLDFVMVSWEGTLRVKLREELTH